MAPATLGPKGMDARRLFHRSRQFEGREIEMQSKGDAAYSCVDARGAMN